MFAEIKNAKKSTSHFVRKCDVLEQNKHYFWNQHPKIKMKNEKKNKQALDFVQQIRCRAKMIHAQRGFTCLAHIPCNCLSSAVTGLSDVEDFSSTHTADCGLLK